MALRLQRRAATHRYTPVTVSELALRAPREDPQTPEFACPRLSSLTDINSNLPISFTTAQWTVLCPSSLPAASLTSPASPTAAALAPLRTRRWSLPPPDVSRRPLSERHRSLSFTSPLNPRCLLTTARPHPSPSPDRLTRTSRARHEGASQQPPRIRQRRLSQPTSNAPRRRMSHPTSDAPRRRISTSDIRYRRTSHPTTDGGFRRTRVTSILHRGAGITEIIFKGDCTSASYPLPPKIANKPKQSFQVFMKANK